MIEEEEEEDEEEEEIIEPKVNKRKREESEKKELQISMLDKKSKRIHSRIIHSLGKKEEKNELLNQKRRKLSEENE